MGQSKTKELNHDKNVEQLSELDLQYLHGILVDQENIESSRISEMCYRNLKLHLSKKFSSELSEPMISVLKDWHIKYTSKDSEEHGLVSNIAKLTHGTLDNLLEFIYSTLGKNVSSVTMDSFKVFVMSVFASFSDHPTAKIFGLTSVSVDVLVKSFNPQNKDFLEIGDLESGFTNITSMTDICRFAFKIVFYNTPVVADKDMQGLMTIFIPDLEVPPKMNLCRDNTLLGYSDIMQLNSSLPLELQHKWRLLYSSTLQGESFSKLSAQITDKGPFLVLVRDQGGYVFGGFISTSLTYSSEFQGDDKSFLFTIAPSFEVFRPTGYNNHYAYLNIGQETIPNGLAMGGQHNYFGLWLSSEFGKGHSKAKPTSTTFGSRQLSATDDFQVDVVEAWGLGNEPKQDEDEDELRSVIDKRPDVVAMLRIAGKEPSSDGYRDSEVTSTQPEVTQLQIAHDPMESP